ncbi:hypothetical protein GGP41_008310 [Bipolaris sorokiniana]|uniref:Uncharacterized protein n=1 Tax=Cochliobolus sativus TaxID=45130 RepID=A0A8H5ZLI4_COCSA|nr:hypothetical protein GGP41_008310 [Bipolaris sorokiniana]
MCTAGWKGLAGEVKGEGEQKRFCSRGAECTPCCLRRGLSGVVSHAQPSQPSQHKHKCKEKLPLLRVGTARSHYTEPAMSHTSGHMSGTWSRCPQSLPDVERRPQEHHLDPNPGPT